MVPPDFPSRRNRAPGLTLRAQASGVLGMAKHDARNDGSGIDRIAELLVERFGADARTRAELITYALHEAGEIEQSHIWLRIVWAINDLRRRRPN
jgi:hypothetical protein